MQRYEKFEGGQEGRKWYVDLAEFGVGCADPREAGKAERANNGSNSSFPRCTEPGSVSRVIGVTDLRLESKPKRLTSISAVKIRLMNSHRRHRYS